MSEYLAIVPLVCVWLGGIAAMLAEAFRSPGERMPIAGLGIIGLLTAGASAVLLWNRGAVSFGVVTADNFGLFVVLILVLVGILTLALSAQVVERDGINAGEYYAITLFADRRHDVDGDCQRSAADLHRARNPVARRLHPDRDPARLEGRCRSGIQVLSFLADSRARFFSTASRSRMASPGPQGSIASWS